MTPFELSRDRWGKAYVGGEVTVSYDAARCIHFAACVRGLPDVFRPGERPWIRPDGAAGRLVAEVVLSCPTGALHFTAPDGTTETPEPGPTVVEPQPDGPLFVRGQVVVRTPNGELRDARPDRLAQLGRSAFGWLTRPHSAARATNTGRGPRRWDGGRVTSFSGG